MSNRLTNTAKKAGHGLRGQTIAGWPAGRLAMPGAVPRFEPCLGAASVPQARGAVRQFATFGPVATKSTGHQRRQDAAAPAVQTVIPKGAIRARGEEGGPYDPTHESLSHQDWLFPCLMDEIRGCPTNGRLPAELSGRFSRCDAPKADAASRRYRPLGAGRQSAVSKGLCGVPILIFKRGHVRPMDAWITEVRALLQGRLQDVFENARDLGNRYLQAVIDANARQEWKHKNTLQLRVRQRGNAVALEWYLVGWIGGMGPDRRMRRTYIPKRNPSRRRDAQVFRYRIEDLLRHTSGWDDDLVRATEIEASEYRREAHYLADMLVTLGRLQRFTPGPTREKAGEDTP